MSLGRRDSLRSVVATGRCTGCGICASVATAAGAHGVEMALSPVGHLRPRIARPLPVAVERAALAVCPGHEVRGPVPAPGIPMHPVWGPIASLARGWAADPGVRYHAAAGGALSALAIFLLETGAVDAILHVRAALPDRPLETDAHVSRTRDDVLRGAQSRYATAAPLVHVHRLLDAGERFAVVAKPCDVSAIRALQRRDPRARAQIPYALTLFCGGVMSMRAVETIFAAHGVEPSEATLFRFRGEGWPGPMRAETAAGGGFDLAYDDAWYDPSAPWSYDMQFRCKTCPDAIGEVADVACPDGWAMEAGRPVHRERDGQNLVIARTAAGRDLVERAIAAGALVTTPCTLAELDAMHSDHHPRRLSAPARALGLRLAGRPALRIRGYRTLAVTRRAGLRRTAAAVAGSFRRARAGRADEPQP